MGAQQYKKKREELTPTAKTENAAKGPQTIERGSIEKTALGGLLWVKKAPQKYARSRGAKGSRHTWASMDTRGHHEKPDFEGESTANSAWQNETGVLVRGGKILGEARHRAPIRESPPNSEKKPKS